MRQVVVMLILLTQLDGNPVWVESKAIQAIRPSRDSGQCRYGGGSAIRLTGMGLCVKEKPDEIREKINGGH
jgi:uncharacterized protein YlzI (FlbEa/FlbD family)